MLLLLLCVVVLVNLTPVQNYLAHRAAETLSKELKTKVTIAHVRIDFLNHLSLQGLYIEDQAHDTLLYAGEAQVRITDWFIFKDKPVLQYLALQNAYAHLYRTGISKTWNYAFIEDAFSTGKKSPNAKKKPFEFDLEKIELEHVRFHMDDKWVGEDLDFDIGSLKMNARDLDFDKKVLNVKDIAIKHADIFVAEYTGGRPRWMRPKPMDTFDTTPFNPGGWRVNANTLSLNGCTFRLKANDKVPDPNIFDENHLVIKNIDIAANTVSIVGDTIHGTVTDLHAQERCGITIRTMQSKVTVSPIASICDQLYLETNHSKIRNYYAMHYKRFPDFLNYIDSVVMVGHLHDAIIDERDIAYFAPQLKDFPHIIARASGDGKGTVANLKAQHLNITDGATVIRGSMSMKGLPDIYKTYITFTDGEILTTNTGILRYFPSLRNNPNVAADKITYAFFKGNYEGYVENFSVNGTFNSNLGAVTTNIHMNVPNFSSNTASYSGTVAANNLQLGILLRQPLLGGITANEQIAGKSFNPDQAQLNLDGKINEIAINNYPYHNITTHGILAKKQFNGTLLVDDPNLALEFDGGINYSGKEVEVNATAHLLGSNFQALHLTTDTITLSADFDLKCTGSNIDNFLGYARLNNIDLKRNSHKLAVDSVMVNSSLVANGKQLTVQSNEVVVNVKGNYQLSKMPASFQYYLSRYMPNYIKAPEKYAPDQNFEFAVNTSDIDSIFAVTLPMIRGFNNSVVKGSLNTSAQKLTLSANIPYGSVGKFHMSNIVVTGDGNLNSLGLNTTIDNVIVGDSMLNGSLSLTSTVGNDSVAFTIATTTPDTGSSFTLNGRILARRDSLFLTMLPSQFFFGQAKWDIAGGSKIEYSDKYLSVQGFSMTSGLQKITASSDLSNSDRTLIISTENLDLGQLGSRAGLAAYQPDGRVNGTVRVSRMFDELLVNANIKATGVKLGNDTVGTINVIGSYNGAKKLLSLDPETGIYRDNASVVASGNVSFDSTTQQKLDGNIQFNNTPVAWASPFLTGIFSHIYGKVNGSISIGGSSYKPEIEGKMALTSAGFRLDYLGCNYTVPSATVHIDNNSIDFNNAQIFDSYKNVATLNGYFSHDLFKDMRMRLTVKSNKFEAMNLTANDNNLFYGNLIAGMDSFTIRGRFDNIYLHMYGAQATAKSRIYIPVVSGGDVSTYSYIVFKTYGKNPEKPAIKKDKINIKIEAKLTPEAEMHIVLDPNAGDEIMATGTGRISLDIPPNNDMHITGQYNIENGSYTFTFPQVKDLRRTFKLAQDSKINFNGAFAETTLDVDAVYSTKARLADLLTESEKTLFKDDYKDAQTAQWVDVKMHMGGTLKTPALTFDLDVQDKHTQGSLAYRKLTLINTDDRQKLTQVGALLLISSFIPPEGATTSSATTGALNNFGQLLSTTASTGLTTVVNKLTGDKQLNIDVQYNNYNYSDVGGIAGNRSRVKVAASHNYLNDRLIVEVGSTSDWGKPTNATTASNFNITGDFRIQYKLSKFSNLRLNCFRTSDYDVTLDRDITRSGLGITWRKSFDDLPDFFRGHKFQAAQKAAAEQRRNAPDTLNRSGRGGTQ